MKKQNLIPGILILAICVFILNPCPLRAYAQEEAEELTGRLQIVFSGGQSPDDVTDGDIYTFTSAGGGSTIDISCEKDIGSLYILWNKIPGEWYYESDGSMYKAGENGFLHEYVKLSTASSRITVHIPDGGAQITDIYAFTDGTPPEWVQIWEPPCEKADLLLFSAHADDEHLFFAGLLPYYAQERNAAVQVVYMTHHWGTASRPHEQLNGLWTVGIRNYPVISEFPDNGRSLGHISESPETVLKRARSVYSEEEWVAFQTEQIRRFKPQVIVGHDLEGEYRHGAHMLTSAALMSAVEKAADETYETESAEKYGLWDTPKTYFHLYPDNPVVMDYDTPCAGLGGKTPFEASKLGYACHLSQQWTWFTDWLDRDSAAEIETYSPCLFGLYRTTVGPDTNKNDLLENITLRADAEDKEEETGYPAQEDAKNVPETGQSGEKEPRAEDTGTQDESGPPAAFWGAVAAAAALITAAAAILTARKSRTKSNDKKTAGRDN